MEEQKQETLPAVQRDEKGRIKKGSRSANPKGNRGTTDAQKIIAWKKKFFSCVTDADVRDVVEKLKNCAKNGEKWAVQEFLNRTLGKVAESLDVNHNHSDVPVQVRLYKVMNILGIPTDQLPDRFLDDSPDALPEGTDPAESQRQHSLPAPNGLPAPVAPVPQEVHGMGEEPSSGGDLDGCPVECEEAADEQD